LRHVQGVKGGYRAFFTHRFAASLAVLEYTGAPAETAKIGKCRETGRLRRRIVQDIEHFCATMVEKSRGRDEGRCI
jgi:hypothetical protein